MSAPSPGADALARLVAPVRGRLLAARALQVLASVATVAPYVAVAELARGMLAGAGGRADAGTWVLVAVVGLLVRAVAGQVAYGVAHVADLHLQAGLRRDLTARLATLPLGWFGRRASGVVRSHLQDDVGALHSQVAHGAVEQTAAVATPLAALAYVAVLDWRLALVAAFVVPVHLAVQAAAMRGLGDDLAAMGQGMLRLSAAVVELVGGIAVVKMYGRAGVAHERYRRAATDFGDGYASWVGPMTRRSALVSVVLSAPTVLLVMLAAGSWAVSAGWTGPVEAVTAALVAATVPPAFVAVSAAAQSRREAEAASLALVALLDEPALGEPDHPLDPDGTDLRLEGVSFGYEPDRPVLEAIDLELPAGTLTALVGPSGAGKSTLAGLVARFHDPDAGRVLLGGVDLREIGSAGVARTVGLVLQDPQLVAVSIADNIRLPRPGASDAEVRAAAVAARVADEIDALPRGFDSVIGTDAQLSGGQEQRVAIARALLGDPGV
ncbi:MAG: ABC transporter ATP-binding protein, partial [Actinomycetaceae bacterium]